MDLSPHEEKILKTIQELGPDHICNQLFQDPKSQAALARLIRGHLIRPEFSAKDEVVDQYLAGQVINHEDFDLHFRLTEKGLEYAQEIYLPNCLFSGRLFVAAAVAALIAMIGIALWLI